VAENSCRYQELDFAQHLTKLAVFIHRYRRKVYLVHQSINAKAIAVAKNQDEAYR